MTKEHSTAAILNLHSHLLTLKFLPRAGWLQRGLVNVESVAEHTFSVAALALLVGDMFPHLERGRLLAIALVHDMAETLTGDMPASARRLFGASAKQKAERQAMNELFSEMPRREEYLSLWNEYAEGSSPEARLVKQLDRLEMLTQALAYERAGIARHTLAEFWDIHEQGWSNEFPLVRALAERLVAERERLADG